MLAFDSIESLIFREEKKREEERDFEKFRFSPFNNEKEKERKKIWIKMPNNFQI